MATVNVTPALAGPASALAYLRVIAREPGMVARALQRPAA